MTVDVIRVVLVDDHAVVRAGLKAVLKGARDIEVVGEGTNGREALALVGRLDPDVVIMDLIMDQMDGSTATKALRQAGARARVLVLTMHSAEDALCAVMEDGASGFLMKNAADRELVDAVRAVAHGDTYVQSAAVGVLAAGVRRRTSRDEARAEYERLTGREQEVFRLIAAGFSAPEIGEQLKISPKTVDTYKQRISEKMGFTHRADYVQFALKLGVLAN